MTELDAVRRPQIGRRWIAGIIGFASATTIAAMLAAPAYAAQPTPVNFNAADSSSPLSDPFTAPADLADQSDPATQRALDACLRRLKLDTAARSGHLSVSLVDITDAAHPRLAQVNGDRMFYAASLPKIAILLGAFEKAAQGKLELDDATISELEQMIRRSSNTAASHMLERVGIDFLAGVLLSERYKLYDAKRNGGLWVGKAYASAGGAQKRDPLHGLSHGGTAYQVARFYYLLETGGLVSREASRRMKALMGAPAIHHKFVGGLEAARPGAALFRKSGTWRNFHSDSAIVERDGRRYIAVALSDDPQGGEWLKNLIVGLDDIVFDRAPQQHASL